MVYIYVLRIDAGRHLIWITPCKPKAQLGVWAACPDPNCEAVQPATGLRWREEPFFTPSCAFGLHGVIQIGRLPASICSV
jgi:hypothetical protein